MDTVAIQKRKLNGQSNTWGAYLLDRDEFGTWFFAPRGTGPLPDLLTLAPVEGWYVAYWSQPWNTTIDVSTPIIETDGVWSYLDLEVDLYLTREGSRGIVDVDEFLDACEAGLITKEQRKIAAQTTGAVERLLRCPTEPFASVGWNLFDRAVALGLDPIRR